MYIEKTIGSLTTGDIFKFSEEDLPFKLLSIEEITDDIVLVDCKATINFYKYDRYQTFKGKLLKELKVYVDQAN